MGIMGGMDKPSPHRQAAPDARDFADYRALLADRLKRLKATDAKFSHRFVNQRMGAKSAGWFADIIAGRQRLKARHVSPLAAIFRLDSQEKEFLRVLVDLETADDTESKTEAYAKWLELKGIAQETLDKDRFKYFDRWYYPAMRELLLLKPFDTARGDYAALGASLHPPISAREAKDAVKTLSRLGLFNPGAPAPVLVKRAGRTPHWRKLLTAYMELALPAMEKFGKDERDFSAVVLSLSPEGLKVAAEEIAALRRRLLAIAERDTGAKRVYQGLIQLFPLSQPVENSDA
jgi:uncharacterized protein (TIGR02147 family)